MASKMEILWVPKTNKFVTWGSEVCLYEIYPLPAASSPAHVVSSTHYAHLLATNSNHHYIRSVDAITKNETEVLLAIGLTNGKVALSILGSPTFERPGYSSSKDFVSFLVPKHARQCNAVAFNPQEQNIVASGLDKHRSESSLLIWDITKMPKAEAQRRSALNLPTSNTSQECSKPLVEFGGSELTNSLAWCRGNSKLIFCGANSKNIKLYDIRDANKLVNSNSTKAVYGLSVDPHDDRHIASFFENQVSVWDMRNFEKPVSVLTHSKPLQKIAWCPTKFNLLGTLQKDSTTITLYDVQHSFVCTEDIESPNLERVVSPSVSNHSISSFSWHEVDENRFLNININGTITDYTVFDRIALDWTPSTNLIWTNGRKLKYIDDEQLNDISFKIRQRAKNSYGLKNDLDKNARLIENNEILSNVWNWLHSTSKLVNDNVVGGTQFRHPGVQSVLKLDPETNKSEVVTYSWFDLGNTNCQGSVRYYKHEDRDKALNLCSWPVNHLENFLENLEREKAYTRAAAIAVFNLKIKLAIDILSRVPDSSEMSQSLNMVAMALAGFSDEKTSVWRQFCLSSKSKLTDPYLKAMFDFLTCENFKYDCVMNDDGIAVDDRVAFACKFLPDNELYEYIGNLAEKLMETGNLDGLLLTGNSREGLKLLQRYLDTTMDIQSTALIAVRAFTADLSDDTVKGWIDSYRNLLDTWQLWYERADFDCMLALYLPHEKPPRQVYVSCNFCGKSVSAAMPGMNMGRNSTRLGGTSSKMSSCPNCRKPLPRCAICLMHMGTTTDETSGKPTDFSNWFSWCQTCRHGGHAGHLLEWFEEHQECPVTGCSCRCMAIDAL